VQLVSGANSSSEGYWDYTLVFFPKMIIKNSDKAPASGQKASGEIGEAKKGEDMAKKLLLIIIAGLFIGCTTTAGQQYHTAATNWIDQGKTSQAQVISWLGAPLSSKRLSNGSDLYYYAYGHRLPLDAGNRIETLQLQIYKGVVVEKWPRYAEY
jgi:hypothetical protein